MANNTGKDIIKIGAICLGLIVFLLTAIIAFKISLDRLLLVLVFLGCPLIHLLMMKGGHKH